MADMSESMRSRAHSVREWATLGYDEVRDAPDVIQITSDDQIEAFMDEAADVISETIGAWWFEREFHGGPRARHTLLDLADDTEDFIRPERLHAVFDLADGLVRTRGLLGFNAFAAGLRSRSLTDAAAEMRAIAHCIRAGAQVHFVNPNRRPGPSPDAVANFFGVPVFVEVKSRQNLPVLDYSSSKIHSTLSSARRQLPPDEASMIYLGIGHLWCGSDEVLASIKDAAERFLRNTRRVNVVVLMMERKFPHPHDEGAAFSNAMMAVHNPRARHRIPTISEWTDPR